MRLSESSCLDDGNYCAPGFRFHPTDEELVLYYLKRKICRRRLLADVITETDVYKWDPEDLPGLSRLKTGDRQWFFFSPRDRKYPNGGRSNRATTRGYWKATGKDRAIKYNSRAVGIKKTLVFYIGRAPSGKRTDWVMHEYTLDEEELKRCESAQDHYALYKVFKKSGPGPKNGEQYGAPFREEDWAEDGCLVANDPVNPESTSRPANEVPFVDNPANEVPVADNSKENHQLQLSLDDLEEFMNGLQEEPINVLPHSVNQHYNLGEILGDEDVSSILVDHPPAEVLPYQSKSVYAVDQHLDLQPSFDHMKSSTSHLLGNDAFEVSSASTGHRQESNQIEEDFLEDFLGLDDLVGPEPTAQGSDLPVEHLGNFQFNDVDGLSEFDLYHDAGMFLGDMRTESHGQISETCMDGVVGRPINQVSPNSFQNRAGNSQQAQLSTANQVSNQLWAYGERYSVHTPPEANMASIFPPKSGVVCDGNFSAQPGGTSENRSDKQDAGTDSWLSSAIWSFVESIPTTPASASESALVNRALERMSSFSRVRINAKNLNVAAASASATSRASGMPKIGFWFFSLFGIVCAIIMGTRVLHNLLNFC